MAASYEDDLFSLAEWQEARAFDEFDNDTDGLDPDEEDQDAD